MDPKSDAPMILAPGASSGTAMRLPAAREWPRVDEYLDPPEVTRFERIGGERREALPAEADHGDPHFHLDQVLGPHLAEGYVGSNDLKTRVSEEQEFASDTCVRREGIDPETGTRYLEELVFEVVHKRSAKKTKERAEAFAARGVRRQIALFVKTGKVCEWSKQSHEWRPIDPRRSLRDPCLARPLPMRAFFDSVLAEIAAARAMEARGNPAIEEMKEKSRAEGHAEGRAVARAEAVLTILEARGVDVPEDVRERILATTDLDTLALWLRRAATVASPDDVFDGD